MALHFLAETGWRKFTLIGELSKLWWLRGPLDELLQKHEALFRKELGTLKGIQAKLEAAPAEAKLNWSGQVHDCVLSMQQWEVLQGPTIM